VSQSASGPGAVKRVQSRDNALFRTLSRLAASARERRTRGATLLDGPHLVQAYREAGGIVDTLVVSESAYARPEIRRLFDAAPARARAMLTDRLFESVAQVTTPTGIMAVIRTPAPAPVPARAETCLLLDGVQDPGNLGSILRSAVAAGVRHVFLSKGCVFAWSPKVLRAGQGAHFFLALHERAHLPDLAEKFAGKVAATHLNGDVSLFDADLSGPVAWVFGAEGAGVSAELAARAGLRLRIPMPGPAESLNVAAAAAICLFEQVRQRTRLSRPAAPPSPPA
jgi:TrmH family RNA methyltransferase